MKNNLFYLLIFFGFAVAYGQTNSVSPKQRNPVLYNNRSTIQTKSSPSENSEYFGFDNKIKEMTLDNNVPEKFPTRGGLDKASYLTVANEWLKLNQTLIKAEFQNTLLKD